jgi:hypothetical protein
MFPSDELIIAVPDANTAQLQIPMHDVPSHMYVSKERTQEVQDRDVPSTSPINEARFFKNLIHESRAEFHALAQYWGPFHLGN